MKKKEDIVFTNETANNPLVHALSGRSQSSCGTNF